MIRTPRAAALLAAAIVVVTGLSGLSGCSAAHSPAPAHPTATTTAAPGAAARLAARFRQSGGTSQVYGIQRGTGPGGVPKLVVWTHDADPGDPAFDRLKASVTTFIAGDQGVSLRHGYLLDVYGPDGRLLHRLDARM